MAALTTVIGREAELTALRARFASDVVQVLAGMGGVGKTSLARAYAHRHRNDYRLVWWIRAEDPAAIDTEFRSLLDVLLPPGDSAKVGDARAVVFALLAQQDDPWLLVFDNVPDPASASGLLPAGSGHVLITSRATGWPSQSIVEPLDTEAAVELLLSQSGDNDRAAAETLAKELGRLPLALTQAAAYARTTNAKLATYLRWYRDKSDLLHNKGQPADYPGTVAKTWQLAMDRLSPNAKALLNLLAFYAPEAIPVHLLLPNATMAELLPLTDEFTRYQTIGELCTYSLITPARSDTVAVHRLVQTVTRKRLPDADIWADAARDLIDRAIPKWPANSARVATWNTLHTHVHAILDHLPPDNRTTLTMRHELAYGIGETGDQVQARDMLSELLPDRERVLGAQHQGTLSTRHELARRTGMAGNAARARDLFADLLPVCERVLGPEHQATLRIRGNLVRWTGEAGDTARARDESVELLTIRKGALGTDHPDTLVTRQNLAHYTGLAGDAAGAREQFAELVATCDRVLGAEHPNTLIARNNLAHWTGRAGEPAQARDMLAELFTLAERVVGAEHHETLNTRHNLAYWTGRAGAPAQARDMLAKLLPVLERVRGAEHPKTLVTRQELARWRLLAEVGEVGPGGGGEGEGGTGGVLGVADHDG